MHKKRRRPSLEILEDRNLLSVYGLAWPNPEHLTVSFVPDGTSIDGTPSNLFAKIGAELPQMETDVLQAFQAWSVNGNTNIAVATDDGRPLDSPGPEQGVPGVGDIRIAAEPLPNNEIAIGSPFSTLGGWDGTIIFNSNANFGDGPNALENFLSAALHEAGHVFGFADETTNPDSAMYDIDTGGMTTLSSTDVTALQSLYGVRQPDSYEGPMGNASFLNATPIVYGSSQAIDADITTLTDKDTYSFTVPCCGANSLTVNVQTAGVSLLTPKLTVYNTLGVAVGSETSTNPLNNNVSVTIANPVPGVTYAQVQSGQSGVFGIGGYRLAAGTTTEAQASIASPDPTTYTANASDHQFSTAISLSPSTPGTDGRWPYAFTAGLTSASDLDFYKIQTGSTTPGATLVTVSNLQTSGLTPVVTVYNAQHVALAAKVMNSGPGGETLQMFGVAANSTLYVEVSAASGSTSSASDNYFLGLTYVSTPITSPTLASHTLTASSPLDFQSLVVDSTRVYHFDLSSSTAAGSPASAVLMTIFNASDNAVFNLTSYAGEGSATGDVVLPPGTYIVRMIAATQTGVALPTFSFVLGGLLRDDPDGPNPLDPTMNPGGSNSSGPPQDPGSWTDTGSSGSGTLQQAEIYGNPYS